MYTLSDLQVELFEKLSLIFNSTEVFYFYPNKSQACKYPRINFVIDNVKNQNFGNDDTVSKWVTVSIAYYDDTVNFIAMDNISNLMMNEMENINVYRYEQGPQIFDSDYNIYGIIYTFEGVLGCPNR